MVVIRWVHPVDMDLRELTWYAALAATENMTATAAELHVSQPTLSRALARLERQLGVKLFDRHQNHLRLNKYGAIFQAHVLRAISELERGSERIESLVDPERGVVSIGFMHDFGGWLVPQMLSRFRDLAPHVTFELSEGAADAVTDDVRHGRVDIGFAGPAPVADDLEWVGLGFEDLRVAVPLDHRFAEREMVTLHELAVEPMVALRAGTGLRLEVDRMFDEAGVTPRISVETTVLSTLTSLVEIGMGVAIIPESEQANRARKSIVTVPLEGPVSRISYGAVSRLGGPGGLAARRFRAFVQKQRYAAGE
jgi:DNA-binding transcriptional LysR family regulator